MQSRDARELRHKAMHAESRAPHGICQERYFSLLLSVLLSRHIKGSHVKVQLGGLMRIEY